MKRRFFRCLLPILIAVMLSGCVGLAKDIQLSSLAQKKRHHEIIRMIQPDVDRREKVSSFQLLLLTGAYYEIRDYKRMGTAADLMDRQIALGDSRYVGADLTVYPAIFRGYAFLDQGEYEKAVQVASGAYTLLNQRVAKGQGFYYAQLIDLSGILGVAHASLNQVEQADHYLAILRGKGVGQGILGPEQHIAIARIHMAKKEYPQALAAVQNPAAKVTGLATAFYDQTFQELPKYFILVKCLYETGNIRDAREGYDQLLKHPQIKEVGGLYWPVLLDRAKIARADGQEKMAEELLREATLVIEKQRSSIGSEAGRIGYVGDKQSAYQELVSLLISGNRPVEAFEVVERAKGRALVDLLASQKIFIPRSRDAVQAAATFDNLAKAEKELDIIHDPDGRPETEKTRGVVIALKNNLAVQAPEFTALVSVTDTPVSEIRNRLAADEALVEYYAVGREWFVFVLKRDGLTVKKLGTPDLYREVQAFRAALTSPVSSDYSHRSRVLYQALIAPIGALLDTPKLTFVPHGPLHYLPFGALSNADGYLIDRATIRVLQTAGVLKFLKERVRESHPSILVMGNPNLGDPTYDLKYAQDEAQAIAGLMPRATLLLRDEAKASYLNQNAGGFTIIHLAAHGLFDPDNPLNSALLLARDGANDGRLRAGDLYRLNLNADLVTLSACETALGKITKGDDVVGFTRGFLYAGAGSIVSTLWKVDDRATKDLMLDFYTKLLMMGKGEALRQAQLNTRKKYPHPFYWASFQLTGNAK